MSDLESGRTGLLDRFDFVRLAGRHLEREPVAFGVGAEVDFGREAAAPTAERFLILFHPFAPARPSRKEPDRILS